MDTNPAYDWTVDDSAREFTGEVAVVEKPPRPDNNDDATRLLASRLLELIDVGGPFWMFYDGLEMITLRGPSGPELVGQQVARALRCRPQDLGVTDFALMTLDAVEAASTGRGSAGTKFRKWLKKSIRPSDDGRGITPEAIRAGLVPYELVPVRSKSGKVLRLTLRSLQFPQDPINRGETQSGDILPNA